MNVKRATSGGIVSNIGLGIATLLGGGFIAIVMIMMHVTFTKIILNVCLNIKDHPLISSRVSEEAKKQEEKIDQNLIK